MADSLSRNVQLLFESVRSKSPHRGSQAAQLASDLYTLCVESVSGTELGQWVRIFMIRHLRACTYSSSKNIFTIMHAHGSLMEWISLYCESILPLFWIVKLVVHSIILCTLEPFPGQILYEYIQS